MVRTRKQEKQSQVTVGKTKAKVSNSSPKKKQKVKARRDDEEEKTLYFRTTHMSVVFEEKFEERPVIKGRSLKLTEFAGFPFANWLYTRGWYRFVSVEEIVYPRLVRMFYCNINKDFITYVKGVEIPLTSKMLTDVFKIPFSEESTTVEASKQKTFVAITGDEEKGNAGRLSTRDLRTLNQKLLHYIIVYTLFPRGGSFSDVTIHDALCLYAQGEALRFDVAFEILDHMVKCRNRKNGALPYGMAITRILDHYGVDLTGEEKLKYKSADTIDLKVISRLGYDFDEDAAEWVSKQPQNVNAKESSEDEEDEQGQQTQVTLNEHETTEHEQQGGSMGEGVASQHATNEGPKQSPPNLSTQLEEIKKELMSHISNCLSVHLPFSADNPIYQTHSPHSGATPASFISTPINNPCPTTCPPTPMTTPTVLVTPTTTEPPTYEPHSSSPSFADLPSAANATARTPDYVSNERVISAIERMLDRMDGIDKRLDAFEGMLQQHVNAKKRDDEDDNA